VNDAQKWYDRAAALMEAADAAKERGHNKLADIIGEQARVMYLEAVKAEIAEEQEGEDDDT
jgi:HEPN domain-containing protein